MTIEGELTVRLDWDGRRVRRVTIRSTRPHAMARVLAGRPAGEAAAMLPRLYGVCAHAQGAAASGALEAACGRGAAATVEEARDLAVLLEGLLEDLRRLLIDLPTAVGEAPAIAPVANVRRVIAPLLASVAPAVGALAPVIAPEFVALCERVADAVAAEVSVHVFGESAEAFLARGDADALRAWALCTSTEPAAVARAMLARAPSLGASDVPPMPACDRSKIEAAVLGALDREAGFARMPHWHGTPVETGALARTWAQPAIAAWVTQNGNGVAARLFARLTAIAEAIVALRDGDGRHAVDAWALREGEGVATVQTARGLLVHRARVEEGRVRDYAIVAPTEWNFHPQGALARGVAPLEAVDRESLARDIGLLVQALDPCVACTVEIADA